MCDTKEKKKAAARAIYKTVNMVADTLGLDISGSSASDKRRELIEQLRIYKPLIWRARKETFAATSSVSYLYNAPENEEKEADTQNLHDLDLALRKRTKIIRLSHEAYKNEDVEAMYSLGEIYENGDGVLVNYHKAASWYREAAEKGHVEAMYCLGKFYENGFGVQEDYFEADGWYYEAAKNGHDEAMNRSLGIKGIRLEIITYDTVPEDLEEWFENCGPNDDLDELMKAADNGFAEAMYWLWAIDQSRQSFYLLERAATNGHVEAMYYFAKELADKKRFDDAIYWFEKAAKDGNIDAMYKLGTVYEEYHSNAAYWLEEAANRGQVKAIDTLWLSAYEKYRESGDSKYYDEAVRWLKKGEEQGDEISLCRLGAIFYRNGSYSNALRCFEKAGSRMSSYSGLYIGLMYYHGRGVAKDYSEAKIWFEGALYRYVFRKHLGYHDHPPTYHQNREGIMYLLSKICEEEGDYGKAERWRFEANQLQQNPEESVYSPIEYFRTYEPYEPHYLGEFWK